MHIATISARRTSFVTDLLLIAFIKGLYSDLRAFTKKGLRLARYYKLRDSSSKSLYIR